jgi:alkylated DNA repair dioxygenase AlkB
MLLLVLLKLRLNFFIFYDQLLILPEASCFNFIPRKLIFMDAPNLLPFNGEAFYYPAFIGGQESEAYFNALMSDVPWEQKSVKIFGKEVMQPRLVAWFSDKGQTYRYSGLTLEANEWNPALLAIREKIRAMSGIYFNSALLNLYRDGNDSVGWHRDNERELGAHPVIASVSLGATRNFVFRNYHRKELKIKINLESGSLLLMTGETQAHWEHALPRVARAPEPRVNITFRNITQPLAKQ